VEDDVNTKLHPYEEAYEALVAVVADRLSKLQVMMIQSQELEVALKDIVSWLNKVENKQDKQETPVLRTEKVNALQLEQQVGRFVCLSVCLLFLFVCLCLFVCVCLFGCLFVFALHLIFLRFTIEIFIIAYFPVLFCHFSLNYLLARGNYEFKRIVAFIYCLFLIFYLSGVLNYFYPLQTLYQEISNYEDTVEQVEKVGDDLLQTMNLGPERDILKYKLANMTRRYANVKDKATERKDVLDQLAPLVQRYHSTMQDFADFLDDSEEKLDALKQTPVNEETAAKFRSEVKVNSFYVKTFPQAALCR